MEIFVEVFLQYSIKYFASIKVFYIYTFMQKYDNAYVSFSHFSAIRKTYNYQRS